MSPEKEVEINIHEYLKEELAEDLFPGPTGEKNLTFIRGWIPDVEYAERVAEGRPRKGNDGGLSRVIPLCLTRSKKSFQKIINGTKDAECKISILLGVYDEAEEGHDSIRELLDRVKTLLLETPQVEGKFSIKKDENFTAEIDEEASGGGYWLGAITFKTFIRAVEEIPIDFDELLRRSRREKS